MAQKLMAQELMAQSATRPAQDRLGVEDIGASAAFVIRPQERLGHPWAGDNRPARNAVSRPRRRN
jgi:hypothetical protein